MWLSIRKDISNDRKVSVNELNQIAENISIHRAQDAVKYKLIDKVMYRDEVIELIEKKAGVEKGKLKLVSFEKFAKKKAVEGPKA